MPLQSFEFTMLVCEQVTKIYRTRQGEVRSLDRLSLTVQARNFLVIRGPSGSGKTTLLLTLGGMLRPTTGHVRWQEADLYGSGPVVRARFRARQVGFVFQLFHLMPYLTVLENVLLARTGIERDAAQREATTLLERFGLANRLHHRPAALSTGERQRAALARALLNRPSLVLADEPTGNLDPENAARVFHHLREYQQTGGTVVVVTHGPSADACATRVIQLRQGRLVDQVR